MTSQYEGFSLALLESRSFGVPCVSYEMPYLEMHRDGRGLIRVPQGDLEDCDRAVQESFPSDPETTKILFDTLTTHNEMGSRIQRSTQKMIRGMGSINDS